MERANNGKAPIQMGKIPKVDIFIDGILVSALIDTGAYISCISENDFSRIWKGHVVKPLDIVVSGPDDRELSCKGYVELEVKIPGIEKILDRIGFLVIQRKEGGYEKPNVLLGSNAFKYMKEVLSEEDVDGVKWLNVLKLYRRGEEQPELRIGQIKLKQNIVCKSGMSQMVECESTEDMQGIVEGLDNVDMGNIVISPALCKVKDRKILVRIVNYGKDRLMKQGHTIATISEGNVLSESDQQSIQLNVDKVMKEMWSEDMTVYQESKLRNLVTKHLNVFSLSEHDVGYADKIPHKIELTDDKPAKFRHREYQLISGKK